MHVRRWNDVSSNHEDRLNGKHRNSVRVLRQIPYVCQFTLSTYFLRAPTRLFHFEKFSFQCWQSCLRRGIHNFLTCMQTINQRTSHSPLSWKSSRISFHSYLFTNVIVTYCSIYLSFFLCLINKECMLYQKLITSWRHSMENTTSLANKVCILGFFWIPSQVTP